MVSGTRKSQTKGQGMPPEAVCVDDRAEKTGGRRCAGQQLRLEALWTEDGPAVLPALTLHQIPPAPYSKISSSGFLFLKTQSYKSRERKRFGREGEAILKDMGWSGESMNKKWRDRGAARLVGGREVQQENETGKEGGGRREMLWGEKRKRRREEAQSWDQG